ncbi:MAG TPA: hypothetical protein VGM39_26420 [Kofleriaceae bacterium]|jgi:hypothetical protein
MRRLLAVMLLVAACGGDDDSSSPKKTVYFDLDGPLDGAAEGGNTYWNLPFPSDLRLTADGGPDLAAYPNPRHAPILITLLQSAADRKGWPTMPVAYVRFTDAIPEHALSDVIAADSADVALIDIDPSSPEKGTRYPIIATTLPVDPFVSRNLVALAPRPGIVLRAKTTYAYVITSTFAPGFAQAPAFGELAAGKTPSGSRGAAAHDLYAPLWPALETAGIDAKDVLVATVFTTGDEVGRLRARSEAVRQAQSPQIQNLALRTDETLDGFCALTGTFTLPQYQQGTQPFDTMGTFMLDANDAPIAQGMMTVPVSITIPKTAMPANGYPLYQWIHGSGGSVAQLVDRGRTATPDGMPEMGKGPGWVVAKYGIAGATVAKPLNPERLVGASDYAYLNINNLAAFPYTFQQGVIEERLFTDALLDLRIAPSSIAACDATNHTSPTEMIKFDATKVMAGGQSMGGMYTNMTAAVEPRWGALVPTGAGGFWNFMILETELIPGARGIISAALGVDDSTVTFVNPGLNTLALGWEIAEPVVYMNRVNRRPLEGATVRNVYQPIPKGDENFTTSVYDATVLSYGNEQAGDQVWPTLQPALALEDLDGIVSYPVKGNIDGHTRIAVQFNGDGIIDPHYIFAQLDEVKHQYGCFLATYLRDGVPTVPAPGAITDPCP